MPDYKDDGKVDDLANELFTSLISDAPVPPEIDLSDPKYDFVTDKDSALYEDVKSLTIEELTEVDLEGSGVFDRLMRSVDLHIQREYKDNRITGDQYAKVYTEVMTGVLGASVQFLLTKDQARWQAIQTQMQARIAEIQVTTAVLGLEKTKFEVQKMVFDMKNSGAQYALTKMSIANENAKHFLVLAQTDGEVYRVKYLMPAELAVTQYTRMQVLPSQVAMNHVQSDRILPAEAAIKEYQNRELQPLEREIQQYNLSTTLPLKTDIDTFQRDSLLPVTLSQEQHKLNQQMPAQTGLLREQWEAQRAQTMNTRTDGVTVISGMIGKQKDSLELDIQTKQFNLDETMPVQLDLIREQREGERSKTLDTRTDGATIEGSVGKQKDLYDQQIDSFIKDAKYKTTKMYLDGWITQKTLDEGLWIPDQMGEDNIDAVLAANRTANDL